MIRSRSGTGGAAGLLCLLLALPAAAAAPVVAGTGRASYRPDPASWLPSYRNQGFEQNSAPGGLQVKVSAEGGWTRARIPEPRAPAGSDPVGKFALAAADGTRSQAEAVARLLQAIAVRVEYAAEPGLAEQPDEVLEIRRASCIGLSALAIAALERLAIRSRPVRGLLYRGTESPPLPHRWIEIWYPDAGWVFSDPTESVNFVSARHVVTDLPGEPDAAYRPAQALRDAPAALDEEDRLLAVDIHPGRSGRLGERRVLSVQYAAAIRVRSLPPRSGTLLIRGQGREWRLVLGAPGEGAVPGLAAGRYTIEGEFGARRERRNVLLADRELRQIEWRSE